MKYVRYSDYKVVIMHSIEMENINNKNFCTRFDIIRVSREKKIVVHSFHYLRRKLLNLLLFLIITDLNKQWGEKTKFDSLHCVDLRDR
jgi:hypothetical protein